MKISGIVTVSQHFSKVLQRHCIRQINQCSNSGFGLSPRLSPDLGDSAAYHSLNSPLRTFGH
jgi:hypothetical protein